jgi:hypothetical protein
VAEAAGLAGRKSMSGAPPVASHTGGAADPASLSWRVAGGYASALLPLAMGWAFVSHNELAPRDQARAALLAGALGVALLFAVLGDSLAVLRPAWPWARSLPWSAAQRVRSDAQLLAAHALPVVAATAALAPWTREMAGSVLAVLAGLRSGAAGPHPLRHHPRDPRPGLPPAQRAAGARPRGARTGGPGAPRPSLGARAVDGATAPGGARRGPGGRTPARAARRAARDARPRRPRRHPALDGRLDSRDPFNYLSLGDVSMRNGRIDEARGFYRQAEHLEGAAAVSEAALGQLALATGDRRAARRWLHKAAARDGGNERVQRLAAQLGEAVSGPRAAPSRHES